jgi:hypothetical protein
MEAGNCAGTAAYVGTMMAAFWIGTPPIGIPSKALMKEFLNILANPSRYQMY